MFYNADKIVPYPCRTIMEDVFMRQPGDYKGSTTLKDGCADLLSEQFKNTSNIYTLSEILEGSADFNASKARPNDDDIDGDSSASDRLDYYDRLEDIDDKWIRQYATQVIIGFKTNNNGKRKVDYESKELEAFYDEEGRIISYSDLEEMEMDFTAEEIREAKVKLPYNLKVLQEGSEQYRAHLLSFIIAMERHAKVYGDTYMTPRHFVEQGVYKVSPAGHITGEFSIQDNTSTYSTEWGFRPTVEWACGKRLDRFYEAYKDLLRVTDILGVDLAMEDPLEYDKDYVDKAVCTYLATNEEYIEAFGYGDPRIIELLKTENLFDVISEVSEEKVVPITVEPSRYHEVIAMTLDSVYAKERGWRPRPELVSEFLAELQKEKAPTEKRLTASDLMFNKGVVMTGEGRPIYIKLARFLVKEQVESENMRGILTSAGKIIVDEDISKKQQLRVFDVKDALGVLRGELNVRSLSYVSV